MVAGCPEGCVCGGSPPTFTCFRCRHGYRHSTGEHARGGRNDDNKVPLSFLLPKLLVSRHDSMPNRRVTTRGDAIVAAMAVRSLSDLLFATNAWKIWKERERETFSVVMLEQQKAFSNKTNGAMNEWTGRGCFPTSTKSHLKRRWQLLYLLELPETLSQSRLTNRTNTN